LTLTLATPSRKTSALSLAVAWTSTLALALALAAGACLDRGVFHCTDKSQCAPTGFCETSGACSYPDPRGACPSGWRYSSHAPGSLADRCVEAACPQDPVIEIRAGAAHACEVHEKGTVACWGAGADGQLGDGARVARSSPAAIPAAFLGPARHVSMGGRHGCALLEDGTVWCWGANEAGQLGDGSTVSRDIPAPVLDATGSPLGDIEDIATGEAFTCAVRASSGEVDCWGSNADGELGLGLTSTEPSTTPQPVGGPGGSPTGSPIGVGVASLSARDRHVCALTREGAVWCWGANQRGELGDLTQISRPQPTAVALPSGQPMQAIATGSAHSCALGGGKIWCWGANQLGELGDGSNADQLAPTAVPLGPASEIVAAGHHTCARTTGGGVWCWGANQAGQLGEGTTGNFGVPVPVTAIEDAAGLTVGDTFSCALRRAGTVWCWGDNRLGQLGNDAPIERLRPTKVGDGEPADSLADAISVSAGGAHTCALRQTQPPRAACWGDNQAGQLGDGTRLDRSSPVSLKIGLDAAQIVTGGLHTCLLGTAGSEGVWCWGRGNAGQLGTSALIDVIVPTALSGLREDDGAATLGAGQSHTCALLKDRSVWCWGANTEGQLGDGTTSSRSNPAAVSGLTDIMEISLGGSHTCALRLDGTVSCWGRGAEGQLGDGLQMGSPLPTSVQALNDAIHLAAGGGHTCAVLADHTVKCWGAGESGQLGWGALRDHGIPSRVMNLSADVVQIVAGQAHTCARTSPDGHAESAGSVFCWGDNRAGQLGNGGHVADLGTGPTPDAPAIEPDATDVAAGGTHTCAVLRDHTVVCWGSNAAGQLGDATNLQFPTAQLTRTICP